MENEPLRTVKKYTNASTPIRIDTAVIITELSAEFLEPPVISGIELLEAFLPLTDAVNPE